MARTVFFISDGTAITAETLGHSLLTQFDLGDFAQHRLPFVGTLERAERAAQAVTRAMEDDGERPIVFHTVIEPKHAKLLEATGACVVDLFGQLATPLEEEFGVSRERHVGRAHGLTNVDSYDLRMEATNYALSHDDGANTDYADADLVMIGVSRSGKTPTCLYLALQFGVSAANYPLTEDDLDGADLPKSLRSAHGRLFGLTIGPVRLAQIREARRPGSRYASLARCRSEVGDAEMIYQRRNIPHLDATHMSVEEICTKVLQKLKLTRRLY
ncbi:MAG: pyruvate, phosphate dikinase/phosphoenolpyruvate synthase regulator [Acidobacteria bacterium]|nr:pyruvate, phosphate dikinase/phosphoenolpyruvate synthase regulator [Acidobacteriota bacterium]